MGESLRNAFKVIAGMSQATFKQYAPILIELNRQLNTGLNMPVIQEVVKHGLNIAGWSIQESGGYFRAFKKVAGKLQGVYLGKNLDGAEQKIMAKEKSSSA